jgi:hypothetical protein
VGRLQLPKEAIEAIAFNGRAELIIAGDHVELWPLTMDVPKALPREEAPAEGTVPLVPPPRTGNEDG